MYLKIHSVKETSKNGDIWVQFLFGSGSCTFLLSRSGSVLFG